MTDLGLARNVPQPGHTVSKWGASKGMLTAETGSYRWMAPEVVLHEEYSKTAGQLVEGRRPPCRTPPPHAPVWWRYRSAGRAPRPHGAARAAWKRAVASAARPRPPSQPERPPCFHPAAPRQPR